MVISDTAPAWLRALTDAAAVLLLLELVLLLIILTALMFALAFGARWLRMHVVPVLNMTVPKASQALHVANQGSERVVRGVAEVYGVRRALQTGLRVMLFGHDGAQPAAAPASTIAGMSAQEVATPEIPGQTGTPPSRPSVPSRPVRQEPPAVDRASSDRDLNNMAAHAG